MGDFCNAHLNQILWSDLTFFHMFKDNFNSTLSSFERKF